MSVDVEAPPGFLGALLNGGGDVLGTGVQILALGFAVGDYSPKDAEQVLHEVFDPKVRGVVRFLLNEHATSGVRRRHDGDTSREAGFPQVCSYVSRDVVKGNSRVRGDVDGCMMDAHSAHLARVVRG